MAAQRGMTLKLPPVQPRSRKALEAVAFARAQGRFDSMHEALFQAFFEAGRDIGDVDVLCEIGAASGLDAQALRQALDQNHHTAEILEDQQLAHSLGVSGVPIMFLRFADRPWQEALPLSGAVPYQTMEAAVTQLLQRPD
jgi:predicted DsbA family dithiol-disulfide isomerase